MIYHCLKTKSKFFDMTCKTFHALSFSYCFQLILHHLFPYMAYSSLAKRISLSQTRYVLSHPWISTCWSLCLQSHSLTTPCLTWFYTRRPSLITKAKLSPLAVCPHGSCTFSIVILPHYWNNLLNGLILFLLLKYSLVFFPRYFFFTCCQSPAQMLPP